MIRSVVPVSGPNSDRLCIGQLRLGVLSSRGTFQSQNTFMADVKPVPASASVRNFQVIQNYVGVDSRHQLLPASPSDATYSDPHAPKSVQSKRPKSDFSIEAILARNAPITVSQQPSKESIVKIDSSPVSSRDVQDETSPLHPQLSWVHCTRYRPPKLLRVKREITTFRTRYRNPRIPFSTAEVAALEKKFRSSPYLGSHDVVEMATSLNMSPKRIKIWFQNRRARERRENDIQ